MSEDVAIVVAIKGDTSGGREIKRSLDNIVPSADKATTATKRLELQAKATVTAGELMGRAFAAATAIFGASQIVRMADGYRLLEARVNSITGSVRETTRVMGELRKISDQTGSSMEVSVGILQRLSFARNEIKATNNEMLVFTETVTKLGIMSGASAESLKAGLTQLGQALSSDILRAEEFNSVMENTPGIGKAIADQLGVTTGQLRLLVVNGKVLRDDIFAAILNQSIKVREEFEQFPRTAEQGFNQMVGRLTQVVDEINKATNGTNLLGGAFRVVGDIAKRVYDGMTAAFEFTVAAITESINLIIKGFNLAIDGVNRLKAVIPGADKTPLEKFDTFDPGSAIKEAANNAAERQNRLFADSTKDIEVETRKISQNYSEIASKLGTNTKLTKEQREAIKDQKKIQDQLKDAVKDSRTETEKLYDKIAEMERLKPFAKTAEQAQAISTNIKNAQDEIEKLRVKAELNSPVGKAFKSLAKEIDGDFKEAFKSVFTSTEGGFKKMFEGLKNTFKNFIAELAYQAAVRPIVVSMVGGVGSAMGLSSGAIASGLGTTGAGSVSSGGGLGLNGLSSIGSGLMNGGLYSQTLGSFGSGVGNLLSGQAWGAMGPSYGASVGAGAFGNLGYGAIGGLGASLMGLGNKNPMVNMATGTMGALAGGAIGTSLGTIFGMAGGPVGAMAGAFLGTALGGLFGGGKPSDKTQGGSLDLSSLATTTNGMGGKKYSAENASFRDAVVTEASNLVKLFQSVGGQTSGNLGYAIGNRDGLRLNVNGSVANYGTNSQAFIDAMMQAVLQGTTGLTGTFKAIVDKIGVGDTAKLSAAFEFGKQFDAFIETLDPKKTDTLQIALTALNEELAQLQKTAIELGLPTDKLTEAYNKQKDVILGSIKAQMAGFQTLEDMTKAYKSFLDGQALGSDSSLTPTQKLQLANDNFGSLLSKAQGGDFSVTQDLLKAASELLNIGRGVYASSASFAGLEDFVRSSVTEIARASGVPGYAVGTNSAASGLAMVGERGPELVRMGGGEKVWTAGETAGIMANASSIATDTARTNAQIVGLTSELLSEQRAQRKELVYLRKQFQRIGDKMAVSS